MFDEKKIADIAFKCRHDLFYLCKYVLGYELMEEHVHADLCHYFESLLPSHPADYVPPPIIEGTGMDDQFHPNNKNSLFLMPRGTFKTSVITIGGALQYILNDTNCRILLDSEVYGKSKAFLAEIKGHMETNDLFREVYKYIHGRYPNDGKKGELLWTSAELNVATRTRWRKEPTISCGALDHAVNGMHYDLIICDDLHSEKNVTNKEQIDQVIDHWKLAYSLLDPGMPMIVIGTRWDYNDLYQHILDNERSTFNILVRRAIKEDGTLLFPERLSAKFLEDTKRKQGSRIFSSQYLNEPVDDETATFKRKDMLKKNWEDVKDRPVNWYLSVDPSFEGEYSDFAALVIAGMDYMREILVRHVLRKKMTYGEIINAMFDLYTRYRPRTIFIETLATQKSIMVELNNQMKIRNAWLPIREITHRPKTKEERIRGLAPFYEFHRIYHISDCPQLDDLEYELLHFPRAKHDDVIDALANIPEFASAPNAGKFTKQETEKDDRPKAVIRPRSRVTGV